VPVRVELTDDAANDLLSYRQHEALPLILKKLLRLEQEGIAAGLPLGGELSGWRKIIAGNRDWRILFRMNRDETVATIVVIGDRADNTVYDEAHRRVGALTAQSEAAQSLAAVLWRLNEERRAERRARRKR
jgi:mRNA interferase RelE/StbE